MKGETRETRQITVPGFVDGALHGVRIGDTFPTITLEVTQQVIDRCAAASLDFNPVHVDPDWCARAQVFGAPVPVLHGMAQMSLLCSVVLRAWGATTRITSIDGKFTKPMFLGETITFHAVVAEVHPLGPGADHVVVAAKATDSGGDTVGVSTLRVAVPNA